MGVFQPNGYGLFDMAGNVWEWCWDWYGGGWYGNSGATTNDTRGPASGTYRVLRGGWWGLNAFLARCAFRTYASPSFAYVYFGFRCVRGL